MASLENLLVQIPGHLRPALEELHHTGRQELEAEQGWAACRPLSREPVPPHTTPTFARLTAGPWFSRSVFQGGQSVEHPAVIRQGRAVLQEGPDASQWAWPVLGGLCQLPHLLRVHTGSQSSSVPFCRRLVVVGMAVFQMGA